MLKINQHILDNNKWDARLLKAENPQLALLFGSRFTLEQSENSLVQFQEMYPDASIISISGAGNILDDSIIDNTIVANSIEFEHTKIQISHTDFKDRDELEVADSLMANIDQENLKSLLLYSCSGINLERVIQRLNSKLNHSIPISGGAAGDDMRFEKTIIGIGSDLSTERIVLIGFYGDKIHTQYGLHSGMDPFGPKRKITKCLGNIVFEIDHQPALDLYKDYLGEKASELPASALHFPLNISSNGKEKPIVRSVQTVDEKTGSLVLFGEVQEGMTVQLMKTYQDNVIVGGGKSAMLATNRFDGEAFALIVSCVGRRIVLGPLTEEELTEAKEVLGPNTIMSGFYSYSELSPCSENGRCLLHNQTITITTFFESA